jgi:hypothetical protein
VKNKAWPQNIGPNDDLYVAVDLDNDTVKYLVFSSAEKGKTLIRDNGAWHDVMPDEVLEDMRVHDVNVDFIDYFDENEDSDKQIDLNSIKRFINRETTPLVAAAPAECPPATLDIALNLKNRETAIKTAAYGPLNPQLLNNEFWAKKAERWTVSVADAKKSLCGNCAAFSVTTKMLSCIADGISSGGSAAKDAWDTIEAGDLGYCEAFDFKCAASRTCDAWITGGPITDEKATSNG